MLIFVKQAPLQASNKFSSELYSITDDENAYTMYMYFQTG